MIKTVQKVVEGVRDTGSVKHTLRGRTGKRKLEKKMKRIVRDKCTIGRKRRRRKRWDNKGTESVGERDEKGRIEEVENRRRGRSR